MSRLWNYRRGGGGTEECKKKKLLPVAQQEFVIKKFELVRRLIVDHARVADWGRSGAREGATVDRSGRAGDCSATGRRRTGRAASCGGGGHVGGLRRSSFHNDVADADGLCRSCSDRGSRDSGGLFRSDLDARGGDGRGEFGSDSGNCGDDQRGSGAMFRDDSADGGQSGGLTVFLLSCADQFSSFCRHFGDGNAEDFRFDVFDLNGSQRAGSYRKRRHANQ